MLYSVWCIRNEEYVVEADSADEAIRAAYNLCPFRPDYVEVEIANNEEEEEEE